MDTLLNRVRSKYPKIKFSNGERYTWSPKNKTVIIKENATDSDKNNWSLLHEVGHALLEHNDYESDFELLQLEMEAWRQATEIATEFSIVIDPIHIEDCLDTYRDWLYQRSSCPACTSSSLQSDRKTYHCFNCGMIWHVSASKLCRPYRRKQKEALV